MLSMIDMPHAPWGREPDEGQEQPQQEWYDDVAMSIDPTRGVLHHAAVEHMKQFTGLSTHDDEEDYTYYGLPALGGSSDIFREFD